VAQGQQVRVYFVSRPANSGASPGGYPSPGSGGYPSTGADNGYAPPGAGGYASPGTGGPAPGSGAQLFDNNSLFTTAKNAPGVIESITKNSDGSATLTVRVTKLPAGVSSASFAIARLSTQVLARNVLLLPLAAISGSGSNTTVQVLVGGKTERRKVVVGKKTQTQVEIVSGLNEGDNVIYTRTFRNSWGSNRPWPGRSGYPQGALRSGYPVPGGSSGQ
jgi:macrolide-specific efflux system membrane fusion protein